MKTNLARKRFFQCFDSGIRILGEHSTSRVYNVDAMCTVGFHQLCLYDEILRWAHMDHHQETNRLHPHFSGNLELLLRDIGLCPLRRNAYHLGTMRYWLRECLEGRYASQPPHSDPD